MQVHPSWETGPAERLFMVACNDRGLSSPPQGYISFNLRTGQRRSWYAGRRRFVAEAVLVPKAGGKGEADVYAMGLVHDSERGSSSLCVFDVAALESGPVCEIRLKDHIPWGIHAQFVSGLQVQRRGA
jgi:all-trans-8'-apo-beta-carotenal 15,15'-oxygenase